MFARAFPKRPRRPSRPPEDPEGPPPGKPGDGGPIPPVEIGSTWAETVQEIRSREDDDDDIPDFMKGYLHIYRTTRPLTKLVYIDGMSAGKTELGTLDMQDLVLRNNTADDDKPAWSDGVRGIELCELGAQWGIEGFVRMEMGFEIIFCEFSDGLVLESARQRPNLTFEVAGSQFETLRGASMRYPGITSQRLKLDYSGMVSGFWYGLNMTNPDPKRQDLPRLPASDLEAHSRIKADFKAAFDESTSKADVGNDWQGITDMVIKRYSDRLQLMAKNESGREILLTEVAVLLNLYVDWGNVDVPSAVDKCSAHYLIPAVLETAADRMIHEALLAVMSKICGTLFHIGQLLLENENDNEQEEAKALVRTLIEYLDWTTWKECGKCAADEICFVAIWPWGSMEDHEHPSCMGNEKMASRYGYWNPGEPPRRPPQNATRPRFDIQP